MRYFRELSLLAAAAAMAVPTLASHGPDLGLHPGYNLMTIRPTNWNPQVTGMEFLPNGDLLVLTWRGSTGPSTTQAGTGIIMTGTRTGIGKLYRVTNVKGTDRNAITATEVFSGFKDAQGLTVVNGDVYVGDIDRVVKMVDSNNDGKYDSQQEIGKIPSYSGWFEYSFGPVHKDGKLYMALAGGVQMSGEPSKQMGIDRSSIVSLPITGGNYTVVAEGLRAPDGIGLGPDGEIFVTDNQGGYRPSSQFHHIVQGRFYGYKVDPAGPMQNAANGSWTQPAIWLPHAEANESPTEPSLMTTGIFKGQFFYGDIGRGGLYRAFLEKVKGEWQGTAFCVSGGFEVGIHRVRTGLNGEIYVGGLGTGGHNNQGWNSTTAGLQKLTPKAGVTTFEILAVRSRAGGMELEFTKPVAAGASAAARYAVTQWGYTPTASYGGPKVGTAQRSVSEVQVSPDKMKVFLKISGLETKKVVFINTNGITSESGDALWYPKTWYTLNQISESLPFETPVEVRVDVPQAFRTELKVRREAGSLRTSWPGETEFSLELVDLKGAVMSRGEAKGGEAEIQVQGLRSGMYVLRATGAGRSFKTKPVML